MNLFVTVVCLGLQLSHEGQDSIIGFFYWISSVGGRGGICVAQPVTEIAANATGKEKLHQERISLVFPEFPRTIRHSFTPAPLYLDCQMAIRRSNQDIRIGPWKHFDSSSPPFFPFYCQCVHTPARDMNACTCESVCVRALGYAGSSSETCALPLVLLLILDICLTVDTGGVQVPVVTQQTEHSSAAARNYHRQTWSTSPNSCFDLPPTTVVTTWICWTVTVALLAEQLSCWRGHHLA